MKAVYKQGSAHVIVIVAIVILIAAALGFVFYKNFVAKDASTSQQAASTKQAATAKPKENTIVAVDGTDMMRYTNNDLGFTFDFPKQTYSSSGCHATDKWYDNYGNLVNAPVTSYVDDSGVVDMTVLEAPNMFTITQKEAPQFTAATYGSDNRQYNSVCKMVSVTQDMIAARDISTDSRSWQVYKIASPDDIATKASGLEFIPNGTNVASIGYSLGSVENGRQVVAYNVTFKDPGAALTGGAASKTWYYPKQKLLVHIGLGQAISFQKPSDHDSYYIGEIVDSFAVF